MTLAFWLMAAALPLAAEPQPAWIGNSVLAAGAVQLGCELVSPGGWFAPGVIHLEPPDHAAACPTRLTTADHPADSMG